MALTLIGGLALAACTQPEPTLGPDGKPLPQLYRITESDAEVIPTRVVEAMNSLRSVRGTRPVVLNQQLAIAAAAHSQDMAKQNRPWHWGSDGSSPLTRAARAGYRGEVLGETISETYETETETLSVWMGQPETRDVILNPEATQMGFAWYQEPSGKIWWTMVTGR
ncbi:serine protease [Thioclava sp. SK-1]|uniref:CAP domain-containing protein n=1 Tax=Thioclava sp. SK-1 TaxID=1889770 RepID=UPI0008241467|nr:CAP domain-containing protein [Thioclava sp. SK-1]OCX61666.1 serine protease [Thioclava sp. SK-1]